MATPYRSEFDNCFSKLAICRVNYKTQAQHTLHAAQGAGLPPTFAPPLTALETHLAAFDENLTERRDPTAGTTLAFPQARKEWLAFVNITMKDHVTPKLLETVAYGDFKQLGKTKLRNLAQGTRMVDSKVLLALYTEHAAALSAPALAANAQAVYDALTAVDATRDTEAASLDTVRLSLVGDLFALKCLLHLRLPNDPDKVYSFFDFLKVRRANDARKGNTPTG